MLSEIKHDQGCGVGAEAGDRVGRSRPFYLESESELDSVKFYRLRLRPGAAGCELSTGSDFSERLCIVSKTLKDMKKWRGSVKVKWKPVPEEFVH